jgi:hypothetical protein
MWTEPICGSEDRSPSTSHAGTPLLTSESGNALGKEVGLALGRRNLEEEEVPFCEKPFNALHIETTEV